MTAKAEKRLWFAGILIGVITACLGLETKHDNHLGWALLLAGTGLSSVGVITLRALSLQEPVKRRGEAALWLPAVGVLLISLLTPLEYLFMDPVLVRSDHTQDIGLILFAGGAAFYLVSLNQDGTVKPPTRASSILLRLLGSPACASLLFVVLGLSIGYSSLAGLLVGLFFVLPALIYCIKMERRAARLSP